MGLESDVVANLGLQVTDALAHPFLSQYVAPTPGPTSPLYLTLSLPPRSCPALHAHRYRVQAAGGGGKVNTKSFRNVGWW